MSYIRIRKHYVHLPYLFLGIVEWLLHAAAVYGLASLMQPEASKLLGLAPIGVGSLVFYASIMSCCTLSMGVYDALVNEGFSSMVLRSLVSFFLLGSLAFTLFAFVFNGLVPEQKQLFWTIIASFLSVLVVRVLFVSVFDAKRISRKVLIFGAGEKAKTLIEAAEKEHIQGIELAGCVTASKGQIFVPDSALVAYPEDWPSYLKENRISEIVVAQDERRRSEGGEFPLPEFLKAKLEGRDVTEVVTFFEREFNRIELPMLTTSWMIYSDGFKASRSRDWGKRIFDLVVSLSLAVLLLPFVIPTIIAIFLETGRPILYHQTRVGKNGKSFRIYKFRSMRQDAEKGGKAVWAQKNDSRVTRVGAFIRNTRLDELPQLYNVIRGDMSFVGPRPERPEFVEELKEKIPYYDVRHTVKPGLMGWAQLKYPYGASVEDAKNKLQYDLYYTKNHSFLMDLLIMIQTVEVVLLGKGVH